MLAVIERVRALRASGLNVSAFYFDPSVPSGRDAHMANVVEGVSRDHPEDLIVILSGIVHTSLTPYPRLFGETIATMGSYLVMRFPNLTSLTPQDAGGTAWNCIGSDCGAHSHGGTDMGTASFIETHLRTDNDGSDGFFYVGSVTASPPAWTPMK
jgi:hypothetical protein